MYELIVLSVLMRGPAHGYRIAKIINDVIGPLAKASNGRIYPLLARLEALGQIVAYEAEDEGRRVRSYGITRKGRERFYDLMMDTTSHPREYQEIFPFKVSMLDLLEPEERLHLIDHYIHYCQAHILHLRRGVAEVQEPRGECSAGRPQQEFLLGMMQHRMRQWELELAWARSLQEQWQPLSRTTEPGTPETEGQE